jgi:hypothetical protein
VEDRKTKHDLIQHLLHLTWEDLHPLDYRNCSQAFSGAVYLAISRRIKHTDYIFGTISDEKAFPKKTIKLKTGYFFIISLVLRYHNI